MSKYITTDFSINHTQSPTPVPEFCRKVCANFFTSNAGEGEIFKLRYDTRRVYIRGVRTFYSLSIRNSYITYWSDLWYNDNGQVIDPGIPNLSLQNNLLTEFVVTEERAKLKYLDLSRNPELNVIYMPLAGKMEIVKLNNLNALTSVELAKNSTGLRRLEMREVGLIAENVLSSFVFSSTPGYIDITGSTINLSTEDQELIEFLQFNNYTLLGFPS